MPDSETSTEPVKTVCFPESPPSDEPDAPYSEEDRQLLADHADEPEPVFFDLLAQAPCVEVTSGLRVAVHRSVVPADRLERILGPDMCPPAHDSPEGHWLDGIALESFPDVCMVAIDLEEPIAVPWIRLGIIPHSPRTDGPFVRIAAPAAED